MFALRHLRSVGSFEKEFSVNKSLLLTFVLVASFPAGAICQQPADGAEPDAMSKGVLQELKNPQAKKVIDPDAMAERICEAKLKDYENKSCESDCTADCQTLVQNLRGCSFNRKFPCPK
jgi:hypothetical protein